MSEEEPGDGPEEAGRPRRYPAPPCHSLDPADWFMHCDLLQDAGACATAWRRSLRVAQSLRADPHLYLLGVYGGRAHPTFDRPSNFSSIFYSWVRPEWVRAWAGARVKYAAGNTRAARPDPLLIYEPWRGTFAAHGSAEMEDVVRNIVSAKKCARQFFLVHAARRFKPAALFATKF